MSLNVFSFPFVLFNGIFFLHYYFIFARILPFLLIIKEKTMSSDILTVEEVAEYLKLAKKTVYKMAVEGTIPAFRVGKFWRFKKTEIEEWIKNNRRAKAE